MSASDPYRMGPVLAISRSKDCWIAVAPAKVNLFLELLHKRPDGYHELETLITPINLYDTLEFHRSASNAIDITCDTPGIPNGPGNLVWKAANALRQRYPSPHGVRIHLTKRIPHEAGLGGGSSDAACTIATLNEFWNLHRNRAELESVAGEVGSDVAALLHTGPTWCTGRGERIEPIASFNRFHLVVIKPDVGLSTAQVYKNVALGGTPTSGNAIRQSLVSGDIPGIARDMFNRLESSAFGLQPIVKTLYEGVRNCDPLRAMLSGSGSCVFALCRDAADAHRVATRMSGPVYRIYEVTTLST